tara:strand:+ start:372 stop:527 length:156 start_codon:yes stop_codon:yes gene_type:complete
VEATASAVILTKLIRQADFDFDPVLKKARQIIDYTSEKEHKRYADTIQTAH